VGTENSFVYTIGKLCENNRSSPDVWATHLHGKGHALIFYNKTVLAKFWATFSQTHLVTLL
jgi:hypothetical protein